MLSDFYLIAGSENGQIVFWDIRQPKDVLTVFCETQTDSINSIDFKGSMLLSGSEDESLAVYNLMEKDEMEGVDLIVSAEQPVRMVKFMENDQLFYENYRGVGVYDFDTGIRRFEHVFANSVSLSA